MAKFEMYASKSAMKKHKKARPNDEGFREEGWNKEQGC